MIVLKLFVILSKKNLALILATVIIALILIGQFFSKSELKIDGSTHFIRASYLKSLGYIIEETDISSKNIIIPKDFSDVYSGYNDLQKQAGFDLSKYKGQEATVYTYKLSSDKETEIHLIISDGFIIGGDIASIRLDGEMKPLKPIKN